MKRVTFNFGLGLADLFGRFCGFILTEEKKTYFMI